MLNKVVANLHVQAVTSDSDMHGTALDLSPYVNVGKREFVGVFAANITSATSDATIDCKLQESSLGTTVSSDWADITGAAFTQVVHGTAGFSTLKAKTNKRYLRDIVTLGGTGCAGVVFAAAVVTPRFDT